MTTNRARFRIMWRFATQSARPAPGTVQPYVVLDLEAPDVEDGEIVVFGSFDSREAALMACMALNGSPTSCQPASRGVLLMGWGEPTTLGAGTTKQLEDAHKALDAVQVPSGSLAIRALTAAGIIDGLRQEIEQMRHA